MSKDQTDVHRAVRKNDRDEVVRLIAAGADRDPLDSLMRSPLTLALQLGHIAIAEELLRENAKITYRPRNALQKADIAFASHPELAPSFQVRLLRQQILNLRPNNASSDPDRSIDKFKANLALRVPDMVWHLKPVKLISPPPPPGVRVTQQITGDGIRLHGNENNASLVSTRSDQPSRTSFSLIQTEITPIVVEMPFFSPMEVGFRIHGELTVPACGFDFRTDPTCYPKVTVENTNAPTTLKIFSPSTGSVNNLPTLPLTVRQGDMTTEVPPGGARSFDRSAGALTIIAGPLEATVFAFRFAVALGEGPGVDILETLDLPSRMASYARIAGLQAEFESLTNKNDAEVAL